MRESALVRGLPAIVRRMGRAWRCRQRGWATIADERFLLLYPFSRFDPGAEAPVLDAYASAVGDGMVVFDIGANAGIYTLLGARHGARVFAFEPSREAQRLLRRHLELNQLHAELVDAVVLDREGEVDFFEQGAANTSSISAASAETGIGLVDAPVTKVVRRSVTIDDFARSCGLWPDVVKLDVEGAEALAIAGAREWLSRGAGLLLLELHPWSLGRLGFTDQDVLAPLSAAGWLAELIEDNGNTRHYRVAPHR